MGLMQRPPKDTVLMHVMAVLVVQGAAENYRVELWPTSVCQLDGLRIEDAPENCPPCDHAGVVARSHRSAQGT
ncbi:hypothetical protein PsorP6_014203 [Peronosclerospora sorghi]|uniref:Uncharacterized protein n=1 Tax=Peronosclerospora sorghi TaxID=230839 RepID=A0ACC0VI55_9STRA|nr:hypothetical protein PsorP6_014203 [Peronosclerospora sorghi]